MVNLNYVHLRKKCLVIYINYTSITPFIRFFDGKKIFNKKYTNVYNNSCTSIYLNKYHMLMPKFVILYNCMKIHYEGVFDDIFVHVGKFIVQDYKNI